MNGLDDQKDAQRTVYKQIGKGSNRVRLHVVVRSVVQLVRATAVREKNSSQSQEKIDRLMKLAAEASQFLTEHGKEDHDVPYVFLL